jgi:hypothetical protein
MSRALVTLVVVVGALIARAGERPALSAAEARRFAAEIANAHCQWRFRCSPFDASAAEPNLTQGRWHWRAIAGHGHSDLLAEVTFSQTGELPTVRIDLMDSRR